MSAVDPVIDCDGFLELGRRMEERRASFPGRIYVIQCGDLAIAKVGYTKDASLQKRYHTLQVGCPFKLSVLVNIEGSLTQERELHERFRRLKIRGEWFRLEGELIQFVESIKERQN